MLNFRPRDKQPSTYLTANDKWRLVATIIASVMLLVIILRLGQRPTETPLPPAESQRQTVEYQSHTLLIAAITAGAAVVTLTVTLLVVARGQNLRRRAVRHSGEEQKPDFTAIGHR